MNLLRNSVVLIVSIFIFAVPAYAIDIFVAPSYWSVDDGDEIWGVTAGLAIPVIGDSILLEARGNFFEGEDLPNSDELSLRPWDLGVQFHLEPDKNFDPYLIAGFTYIDTDADTASTDSDYGYYAGIGVNLNAALAVDWYGELIYRLADVEVSNADFSVDGFTVNVGVKFSTG